MKDAPEFKQLDQNGNTVSLADYSGKWLVLYFYPLDDTPGCTKEACAFKDGREMLQNEGAEVLGVSQDSVDSHKAFADKFALNFTLLSDTGGKVARAYGAVNTEGRNERKTFLINPEGKIAKEYPKVSPSEHPAQVLEDLRSLTSAQQ